MSNQYAKWPRFGGKPVNPDLVRPLNAINPSTLVLMKTVVSQGAGDARASNGTHTSGHALDFKTSGLAAYQIKEIVMALNDVGFAAVLRLVGDNLGAGIINRTEHIHAAYRGHSNYAAVKRLIGVGGRNHIDKKLAARKT